MVLVVVVVVGVGAGVGLGAVVVLVVVRWFRWFPGSHRGSKQPPTVGWKHPSSRARSSTIWTTQPMRSPKEQAQDTRVLVAVLAAEKVLVVKKLTSNSSSSSW